MDLIIGMIFSLLIMIYSVFKGIFIGIPLFIILISFCIIGIRRGNSIHSLLIMCTDGAKKALIVLRIFVLIGGITGIWIACGTVPSIVYYGILLMYPKLFILFVFIITSIVSLLLGTAFGTVGTVGIAFMIMAKTGGVNSDIVAGAILAGAFFGDRCSPMSSSANLVANITNTKLYTNIKNMIKSGAIPTILTCAIYLVLSVFNPLQTAQSGVSSEIVKVFDISIITLLPAAVIIILSLFRIDVSLSMIISIVFACIIGIVLQGYSIGEIIHYIVFGYYMDIESPLKSIIKGGGVISMWKPAFVVFVSCSLSGILHKTGMLDSLLNIIKMAKSKTELFIATIIVSLGSGAFGCNQSIAIVLTEQLMRDAYKKNNLDNEVLALNIEDTAIVIAPLIPWNIAALVPTSTLEVSSFAYLPYAVYLYLLPIVNLIFINIKEKREISYEKMC